MRCQVALLGLLVILSGPVQGASFTTAVVRPLLKVHEDRLFVPLTPIATSFHFDDDLLVTQDGAFSYQEVERQFFIDSFRSPVATLSQGTVPAAQLAALHQALAAAQIGTLGDAQGNLECHLFLRPEEGYVLSWYGRTNRAVRVVMTSQTEAPDCPATLGAVLQAVQTIREGAQATATALPQ